MNAAGGARAAIVGRVERALSRIARLDPDLCAFVEVWEERARESARTVDVALPLAGLPFAVKGPSGIRSYAALRLMAAGAVPVGATSVPGAGTYWQTWGQGRYGRTVNPYRSDRTPGGSSAGSAVAVAAGMVPLATGSDGAGSVRIPAAWCGVFGLKTTNGRLPSPDRTGLASAGVLTRTVAAADAYLRCVLDDVGPDTVGDLRDIGDIGDMEAASTSRGRAARGVHGPGAPSIFAADKGVPPVAAAYSADLGFAEVDAEVSAIVRAGVATLERLAVVQLNRETAPFTLLDPRDAWLAIRGASSSTAGAGVDAAAASGRGDAAAGREERTRPRSRRSVLDQVGDLREENNRRLDDLFRRVPLLITPATPNRPHGHEGPGELYSTALTWAFNLSGHPAVSIPIGRTSDGCPVGLQVVADRGEEFRLLDFARAAELRGVTTRT